jgi:hypothetical protein
LGIVTTSSERLFSLPAESIYDFLSDPRNWTKTYPGSAHIAGLPERLPLMVGDTWSESGPDGNRIFTWHLAMAIEAYKHAPLPDALFKQVNPANIDSNLAAIARELG